MQEKGEELQNKDAEISIFEEYVVGLPILNTVKCQIWPTYSANLHGLSS